MDNLKSYEFIFLYLINKCILLFKYIDNNNQKAILYDIQIFINKLQEIFSNKDFKNNEEKKNKILEVLIKYFEEIIDDKIYNLLNIDNREQIIINVEKQALQICEDKDKYKDIDKYTDKDKYIDNNDNDIYNGKYTDKDKDNAKSILHKSEDIENIINSKVKTIFSEIKATLKDYLSHTENVEYDLDKKFNIKIQNNNIYIESKIKELINNDTLKESLHEHINTLIKTQIIDIYSYVNDEIKSNMKNNIEQKIVLLGEIFNENIHNAFNNIKGKMIENEKELLQILGKNEFNKNNFDIIFDKEQNEIKLHYYGELISSSKINIKGLIGPKGVDGKKGDKGDTPIIRKINFTDNNKLKFVIQETNNNIYEVITDDNVPNGPQGIQGIQGEKGDTGKTYIDLKWDQDNVMRVDGENKDSLIFLKSLCVGDKSHCLKDNSLAISGAKCYQNSSFAIGNNSKTLDTESIALFGSCIGKKALSYRADNIDENNVQFGKKEKANYNISSFNIVSKEIIFDCDIFKIKTNKYENNKIKELEDRIILLEKKFNK